MHPPLPHHPAPPTQQRHPVGPPPPGPPEPYGNPAADPYARTPGPELPPLRLATSSASMNGGGASGDPEVMMGVEYNRPRTNGYQPPPY